MPNANPKPFTPRLAIDIAALRVILDAQPSLPAALAAFGYTNPQAMMANVGFHNKSLDPGDAEGFNPGILDPNNIVGPAASVGPLSAMLDQAIPGLLASPAGNPAKISSMPMAAQRDLLLGLLAACKVSPTFASDYQAFLANAPNGGVRATLAMVVQIVLGNTDFNVMKAVTAPNPVIINATVPTLAEAMAAITAVAPHWFSVPPAAVVPQSAPVPPAAVVPQSVPVVLPTPALLTAPRRITAATNAAAAAERVRSIIGASGMTPHAVIDVITSSLGSIRVERQLIRFAAVIPEIIDEMSNPDRDSLIDMTAYTALQLFAAEYRAMVRDDPAAASSYGFARAIAAQVASANLSLAATAAANFCAATLDTRAKRQKQTLEHNRHLSGNVVAGIPADVLQQLDERFAFEPAHRKVPVPQGRNGGAATGNVAMRELRKAVTAKFNVLSAEAHKIVMTKLGQQCASCARPRVNGACTNCDGKGLPASSAAMDLVLK